MFQHETGKIRHNMLPGIKPSENKLYHKERIEALFQYSQYHRLYTAITREQNACKHITRTLICSQRTIHELEIYIEYTFILYNL